MDTNNLMQAPAQMPQIAPEENKSSWKKIAIALAVVFVVIGGAYYYIGTQNNSDLKGRVIPTAATEDTASTKSATTTTESTGTSTTADVCAALKTKIAIALRTADKEKAKADGNPLIREWGGRNCGELPASIAASWDRVNQPDTASSTTTTGVTGGDKVATGGAKTMETASTTTVSAQCQKEVDEVKALIKAGDREGATAKYNFSKVECSAVLPLWDDISKMSYASAGKTSSGTAATSSESSVAVVSKCDQLLKTFSGMLLGSTDKNAMRIAGTPMVADLTANKCTIPADLQAKWNEVKNSYAMSAPTAEQCKVVTDELMSKIKAGDITAESFRARVVKLGCAIPDNVEAAYRNFMNNLKNPTVVEVDPCLDGIAALTGAIKAKNQSAAEAAYVKMTRSATKPCVIPDALMSAYQQLMSAPVVDPTVPTKECVLLLADLDRAIASSDKTKARTAYNTAKPKCTIPPATESAYAKLMTGGETVVVTDICPAKAASFQSLLDMGANVTKTRLEAAYTSLKNECAKSVTAAMENTYAQLMSAGEVVTEVPTETPTETPTVPPAVVTDNQEAECIQKIGKFDNAVSQGIISLADVLYNQIAGKCMISQDSMDLYNALKNDPGNNGDGGYVYNGGSGSSNTSSGLGGGSVSSGSGSAGSSLITYTTDNANSNVGNVDTNNTNTNSDYYTVDGGNSLPSWGAEGEFDNSGAAATQNTTSQIQSQVAKPAPKNLGANVFVPQQKANTTGMKNSAATGPEAALYLIFAAMSYGATVITRKK